jgi:predicted aspartyl protease
MALSTRFGHLYVLLFWAVVMGVVWVAMERFMVDTGATGVVVTEAFAQDAALPRGETRAGRLAYSAENCPTLRPRMPA